MKLGFREDKRAVSALVGAILLLAILIIALSSYQAFIVPNQNAETEFDHNQQVEDEMVELRNALLEARLDNRERATSVKLGTRYQSRTLAVNPPPATGTLQSSDQANMIVDGDNIAEFELIGNQFIEYTPSYSEYRDAGTIRYENTLVYHEFDSSNVTLSNQRLVRGNTIRLVPSEPGIDEQGIDRVTYEPDPTAHRVSTITDPEISVPTELSENDWVTLLDGQDYDTLEVDDGVLEITFSGQKRVIYSIVDGQDLDNLPEDEADEDSDSDPVTEVNPAGPSDVRLVGVNETRSGGQSTITMTFKNGGDDTSFISGRVSFLTGVGNNADQITEVNADGSLRASNWDIGDNFRGLAPPISLPSGQNTEVEYVLNDNFNTNQDFLITSLTFEGGKRSTYFVGGEYEPSDPINNGNGDGGGNGDNDEDGESEFASLEATGNQVSGQITEVTFTYSVTQTPDSNEVVFSVTDGAGDSNTASGPASTTESTVTVDNFVDSSGNNAPAVIEANITDGQCLSAEIDRDESISIGDFSPCNN